jgi:BioD-like phosphotransacetylase family protein
MKTVLVSSTRRYAGKSGICLALIRELEDRGLDVGYCKPYGTLPQRVGELLTDQDAYYINEGLRRPGPAESACPVVQSRELLEHTMERQGDDLRDRVLEAFRAASERRDVMVVEGPGDVFEGSAVMLNACQQADLLDGGVLLVDRPERSDLPDRVLGAAECLGPRLRGVLFNHVPPAQLDWVRSRSVPFLRSRDIAVFGVTGTDPMLTAVPVSEVVSALGGIVVAAEDHLANTVEAVMIGAMGQEKALRFFRRKGHKAVVTGGDRADVQLAALETDTSCVVATGGFPPSPPVLVRAEELGVPVVLVDYDTLSAVERLDALLGRVRLHDPAQVARIRALLTADASLPDLLAAFGLG